MKKVLALGVGLVGKAIAIDLSIDYKVTAADKDEVALKELKKTHKISTLPIDLANKKLLKKAVADFDLVVCAVPGFLGYTTIETVIQCKKDLVDISFFPEDPFHLNKLAQQNKVTAIVDCGVAPGLSNIIAGYHYQQMNVENFECYVGGLPFDKKWPYEYKAPFSPIDVIEEYTRPARLIINHEEVVKEALSEIELVDFKKIGKLEAFNSDGLRTLLHTMDIANMKEKTLRYPGHAEKMRLLRDTGLFDKEPVNINGKNIRPIDLTTKLLFPLWELKQGEPEFTVMRIIVEGEEDGKQKKYHYELYDESDKESGWSSMSRTTGFTCTAAARLVLEGDYTQKGISPPEYLGAREECFEFVLNTLKHKGVSIKCSVSK